MTVLPAKQPPSWGNPLGKRIVPDGLIHRQLCLHRPPGPSLWPGECSYSIQAAEEPQPRNGRSTRTAE